MIYLKNMALQQEAIAADTLTVPLEGPYGAKIVDDNWEGRPM